MTTVLGRDKITERKSYLDRRKDREDQNLPLTRLSSWQPDACEELPEVPEFLVTPSDRRLTKDDFATMSGYGSNDQLDAYPHRVDVLAGIMINDKAALRLQHDKPEVYRTLQAAKRIARYVRRTTLTKSHDYQDLADDVVLKLENTQSVGSFKIRGAANFMLQLSGGQLEAGVAIHSQGNAGYAAAHMGQVLGVPVTVFAHEDASSAKLDPIRSLGARVIQRGSTFEDAAAAKAQFLLEHPLVTELPPFDHPHVVDGQRTLGLEIFAQDPSIRSVYGAIAGGSLMSGVGSIARAYDPGIDVVGVQLVGSDSVAQSFGQNRLVRLREPANPLSDGTAIRGTTQNMLDQLRDTVDRVIVVSEEQLAQAVIDLESRGIKAEAAGALSLAGLRADRDRRSGRACAIVSGGNRTADALHKLEKIADADNYAQSA